MSKSFFWCVELSHSDGSHTIHFFEANSFDSFPSVEGEFVDVTVKTFNHENS